ncbi:MAG: thiol peroxidase [Candidatus Loosdrechtia sp.]|uniref:thiol peroxidase n=1 Tax=Candidatus Loosdrechtia sp. TaxID=3101272 RepID=UPI003A72F47B|nr:MAG: thiol peroxidase [Candidatus Jettenia sp. AMX2]
MQRNIQFKGKPLTLVGRKLKQEAKAPDFKVVSRELKDITLKDFRGKIKVITSFLSLDTPVCDLQVREFNRRASQASEDVVILGISKDLPFAQKRFCEANAIKNALILSDYHYSSFGINYGLLIKELNLLARAVVILDKNDRVRHIQVVNEATNPPDYEDVFKTLDDVIKKPELPGAEPVSLGCKPCEGGIPPLPKEKIDALLPQYQNWELAEGQKLRREFKFKNFTEAKYFFDLVSVIAEEQGHHPTLTLAYNKLKITLTTHAAGGLTENDFIMARIIEDLHGE